MLPQVSACQCKQLHIYTDGSFQPTTGAGGWAYVVAGTLDQPGPTAFGFCGVSHGSLSSSVIQDVGGYALTNNSAELVA
eukprot:4495866-Alexandrium_andersonii.AAC.1